MGNTVSGLFGNDEEEQASSVPTTKEDCVSSGEKLVYWDEGECKVVDNALIAKLNACNKSGSHFDFTDMACKSNLTIVPRCGEGKYWHEQEGETGKCLSREELCKFKSVELAEGFAGRKYAAVHNEGAMLVYVLIIAMGLAYIQHRRK